MLVASKLCRRWVWIGISLCVACSSGSSDGPNVAPPADSRTTTFFEPIVGDIPPEVLAHAFDWPLPHANYDNTRQAAASGIDSSNVEQLHEVWRMRMSLSCASNGLLGCLTANPLVLGDTVYTQDVASNVYAVARDSGKLRWKHEVGNPAAGPNGVAVGWGGVFATTGDDTVFALDNLDGAELTNVNFKSRRAFGTQPILYGQKLFTGAVPVSEDADARGGQVLALGMRLMFPRWHFDMPPEEAAASSGGGGVWYPGLIDRDRGIGFWGSANAVAWPGLEQVTADDPRTGALVALDLQRGELKWSYREDARDADFQNSPLHVPADGDRGIEELVIGSGKTGSVVALEPENGALKWRVNVPRLEDSESQSSVLTAPAYAEGVLYVPVAEPARPSTDLAAGRGALLALDVRNSHELWRRDLPAPCYSAATLANDLVFTATADGHVYAFERASGREVWHYEAPGGINAPLVVAGDLLLISLAHDTPALIALSLTNEGTGR